MGAMALAQPAEEDAGTDAGAAAKAPASKPDAGAPPAPPAPHSPVPPALNEKVRAFFTALLAGEPAPLVQQAELPFFLEDKRITSAEQLKSEWLNRLRSKRTDLLSLKG